MYPKSSVPPGAFYYMQSRWSHFEVNDTPFLVLERMHFKVVPGAAHCLGRSCNELAHVGYAMGMEDSMRDKIFIQYIIFFAKCPLEHVNVLGEQFGKVSGGLLCFEVKNLGGTALWGHIAS